MNSFLIYFKSIGEWIKSIGEWIKNVGLWIFDYGWMVELKNSRIGF